MNSLSANIFRCHQQFVVVCCRFSPPVRKRNEAKCHFRCRLAHGDDYNVAIMAEKEKGERKNESLIMRWRAMEDYNSSLNLKLKSGSNT
jgi:hypothetical protein